MLITDPTQCDTYYQALLHKESRYVGIFFAAVKTTSIFCIPTCRARKPKRENVEFYTTFKEPLDHGYRPCKICKPTEHAHEAPSEVEQAIQLVKQDLKSRISDDRLRAAGISPDLVRRWFKRHYDMTFHAYQRMYRVNHAYQELQQGKRATASAFDAGYESLSGFGYTYKKLIGQSPRNSKGNTLILIDRFTTPLGPMFICATDRGICLLEFVDREILEKEFKDLQRLLKARIIIGENAHIQQAKQELGEYFSGKRQRFEVALDFPGTDFQQTVWRHLQQVPFGMTSTYTQVAQAIGKPTAVRAVAAANGANRIAIMIPCHRVIGKQGGLRGYGGGLERKKWLIEHER